MRIIVATGMLAERCAFAGAAARSYRCAANPKRTRSEERRLPDSFATAFDDLLREDLAGRIAPLDRGAAAAAGQLAARREAADRPDRADIAPEMITVTMQSPDHEAVQADGRIHRWRWLAERGRWLRVVLVDDGATVHNAFWDRGFRR